MYNGLGLKKLSEMWTQFVSGFRTSDFRTPTVKNLTASAKKYLSVFKGTKNFFLVKQSSSLNLSNDVVVSDDVWSRM